MIEDRSSFERTAPLRSRRSYDIDAGQKEGVQK